MENHLPLVQTPSNSAKKPVRVGRLVRSHPHRPTLDITVSLSSRRRFLCLQPCVLFLVWCFPGPLPMTPGPATFHPQGPEFATATSPLSLTSVSVPPCPQLQPGPGPAPGVRREPGGAALQATGTQQRLLGPLAPQVHWPSGRRGTPGTPSNALPLSSWASAPCVSGQTPPAMSSAGDAHIRQ